MAVRECGYQLCLDMCRAADTHISKDNEIANRLRATAISLPNSLAKGVSRRPDRKRIRNLKQAYVASRQLSTLLMLCHDLNYIPTEEFLKMNSMVNIFSAKLNRFIRFSIRKYIAMR
ncbi:four helix bundle protein [Candidatus Woesearchaeota archaeon]|nr:four helix bundle protein [Candidatus Woesearchaeota archaeon]